MFWLAVVFLVIALIVSFFRFPEVENLFWIGTKILFVVFLVLAVLAYLGHDVRRWAFWE